MQSEIGVHRLVRISPFGSGDTRQTSFAAVDVVPELDDDINIEVNESETGDADVLFGRPRRAAPEQDAVGRATDPQVAASAAESRTERSQHKNYDNALKLLKARLYAIEEQKRTGDIEKRYDAKGEIAFGSQIRSYVLQPYTLVRDERPGIEVKTPQVMQVLDGDLDEFMQAYLRHKTERQHKKK